MNKYQKALIEIALHLYTGNKEIDARNEENLKTLQHLIDEYVMNDNVPYELLEEENESNINDTDNNCDGDTDSNC